MRDDDPRGVIVTIPVEVMLACREELIKVAQQGTTITLADLYDKMATHATLKPRMGSDDQGGEWVVWMYGLLQLVMDDCHKRDEPLLPSLVLKENGHIW